MAIHFVCPGCGERLVVQDHHAGKTARCPGCRTQTRVAPQPTRPEPPTGDPVPVRRSPSQGGAPDLLGGIISLFRPLREWYEARQKAQELERRRREDEARLFAEAARTRKQQEQAYQRQLKEEEERRRKEAEEAAARAQRQRKEEEERRRKEAEEAAARALWRLYHESKTMAEVHGMSGREFEEFLARLLSRMGYRDVSLTPTNDQGADILCRSPNGDPLVIQAKRWKGSVGNMAVQELLGAMRHYRCRRGMVVTNSTFTSAARELARKGSDIVLRDGQWLAEQIAKFLPTQVPEFNWEDYNRQVKDWWGPPVAGRGNSKSRRRRRRRWR